MSLREKAKNLFDGDANQTDIRQMSLDWIRELFVELSSISEENDSCSIESIGDSEDGFVVTLTRQGYSDASFRVYLLPENTIQLDAINHPSEPNNPNSAVQKSGGDFKMETLPPGAQDITITRDFVERQIVTWIEKNNPDLRKRIVDGTEPHPN